MFSLKELVSPAKQEVIASSTALLVNATSTLLATSHEFMQNPDQPTLKVRTSKSVAKQFVANRRMLDKRFKEKRKAPSLNYHSERRRG